MLILQRHPTAAPLWFRGGSSPGFRCSFPKYREHAAWPSRPRCIHHPRRSSSASRESWEKSKSLRPRWASEEVGRPSRRGFKARSEGRKRWAERIFIHPVCCLTCSPGLAASAWAQVHHRAHTSGSPCRRTPWWCDLLCWWGSSCTGQNIRVGWASWSTVNGRSLFILTFLSAQILLTWWQWCCWCLWSLWRRLPAPECSCSTPRSE